MCVWFLASGNFSYFWVKKTFFASKSSFNFYFSCFFSSNYILLAFGCPKSRII
jgi:hypothetical protein